MPGYFSSDSISKIKSVKCEVSRALKASFVGRKMLSEAEHEGRHAWQCWTGVNWSGLDWSGVDVQVQGRQSQWLGLSGLQF